MLLRNLSEVYKKGLYSMSDLYNRIEKLCNCHGITITSMCKEAGASRASLSDLKVGRKQGLSTDTLSKIAKVLGVSVGLLIGEKPEWEYAIYEFGFCWDSIYRETKKADARTIVNDPNATLTDKVNAQIVVFKALFSRSLESLGYDLDHPDFPSYVAMILNQGAGKHNIPSDVYFALVQKYGKKAGIPRGTYFLDNKNAPTASGERTLTMHDLKVALFRGRENVTDAMVQEVLGFADLVALREDQKKKE